MSARHLAGRLLALLMMLVASSAGAAAPALAMPPGADGTRLREAATALDELRVEQSAAILEELRARYPDDPDVQFEVGLLRYHQGNYVAATQEMSRSVVRAVSIRSPNVRAELHRIAYQTRRVTAGFVQVRSEDGRYVVRHAPGPDAVLVPYALDTLARADRALQEELGVRVPGPLLLELYPTATALSEVSSLSVEEIERTGTVALCKWDRLMVTTPRALVRGYPWADTIGHELVHLVLSRASRDRAPVWMQEGFARFLERRWRGEPPRVLMDPGSAGLLHRAATSDSLLPFDRLHPSIAMLPTAEDAALAFAQVSTFIEGFHAAHGSEGLRAVVSRVAEGVDAREAFAQVAGSDWDALERSWREAARARPAPSDPSPVRRRRFRHGAAEQDDLSEVEVAEARRRVRLGDLLWAAERPLAASVEYGAAYEVAEGDSVVASRLARAALAGGDAARAIEVLEPMRARLVDHEPLYAVLGAARIARGELEQGREALREAIRINPFDPQPHCDLAGAAESEAERRTERSTCVLLGADR